MKRGIGWFVTCIAMLMASVQFVSAQNLPQQIKIIVPFPPGGPTDVLARYIAQGLSENLKRTVFVENRPGANATVGAEQVARAAPDGSTLLFNATHQVVTPALFKKLPYDTEKDFTAVGLAATVPNALVVNPNFEAKTLAELIALAKKEPGKLSYGSFGGSNQLAAELFKKMAGVDIVHIPYKGQAPAMNDVVAGHLPMMFDSLPTSLPVAEGGRARILAVTSAERSKSLPDVPTIAEAGNLPGYEANAWFGLFMPAAEGSAVQKDLAKAMADVLARKDIQEKFIALGATPGTLMGDDFTKFVHAELKKWRKVVDDAGIERQ
ncbi:putative secreted protein [Afipia carboxidovorans OM5]|uniref:Bordetella uptake protein n=1 Tax=Afipia carboxidovorans (strain ATCC 49405 / DSM 1227 / KCTC 32145 / OM5) TaxID=504832 RepID=B6JBR5_AFIC5|nr:tripartite tricarboxylate transporter substrate binding protein [Afipia carboxidovorans]ACI92131.1 putative secreted protein [Afipia carboxidovorans OM5]AEI04029.1 bordetella uptake gene [Afipia carboxidovorans OM4]AEI07653.1 bordetella uptake protein [Afipia carboxidovorans OM5]